MKRIKGAEGSDDSDGSGDSLVCEMRSPDDEDTSVVVTAGRSDSNNDDTSVVGTAGNSEGTTRGKGNGGSEGLENNKGKWKGSADNGSDEETVDEDACWERRAREAGGTTRRLRVVV